MKSSQILQESPKKKQNPLLPTYKVAHFKIAPKVAQYLVYFVEKLSHIAFKNGPIRSNW